jgi:hypothetical protein
MEPTLGGGVGVEDDQLIEEIVEVRLVSVGVDKSEEIHHVVEGRDHFIDGLLFFHDKELCGLLGLVTVQFTMEILALRKLLN